MICQTFQVSLAVYGLGKEVYACFNHFTAIETQTQVLMSLRKLLVAWPDAAELEDDSLSRSKVIKVFEVCMFLLPKVIGNSNSK